MTVCDALRSIHAASSNWLGAAAKPLQPVACIKECTSQKCLSQNGNRGVRNHQPLWNPHVVLLDPHSSNSYQAWIQICVCVCAIRIYLAPVVKRGKWKSTIYRWFSQLETSTYNGFPIATFDYRRIIPYNPYNMWPHSDNFSSSYPNLLHAPSLAGIDDLAAEIKRLAGGIIDGWMDGWMDGRMDGWMDSVYLCISVYISVYLRIST